MHIIKVIGMKVLLTKTMVRLRAITCVFSVPKVVVSTR